MVLVPEPSQCVAPPGHSPPPSCAGQGDGKCQISQEYPSCLPLSLLGLPGHHPG